VSFSSVLGLPAELQVLSFDLVDHLLLIEVASTAAESACPVCQSPTSRIHSHYSRKAGDLACGGHQVQLILHVRKFFCTNQDCSRKIFAERLTAFLEPWARVTTRLGQQIEAIGLASCGRLGARLGSRLRIEISRTSILRRVMKLATKTTDKVAHLGVDDFSLRRGRTFGTVLVDLQRHQILDLLPDRQKESAAAWMKRHPEITHVSRDRGKDSAAAAKEGAPQAIQVADRYHIGQNLAEAVQLLLARILTELKQAQDEEAGEPRQLMKASLPMTQWPPTPGKDVQQAVAKRRAEREDRYQQVAQLREQGLTSKQIAARMLMNERTVRHWLQRKTAPDVRPRRKYASDFDAYAPYVLQRWQAGCRNGLQLWREIAAQGYPGSSRMVSRFLDTLKAAETVTPEGTHRLPHYTSKSARWLFMRRPAELEDIEQEDLAAFRLLNPSLNTAYGLVQDFLQMMRKREGERLDDWLRRVHEGQVPEGPRFAHGVEEDYEAVKAGLTLALNNGQVEGHVTKIKLIKRMMYGRAEFPLLRQRVLHTL
jgi:transposase